MEIILKKNVDKLGYKDEVVTVKPGYGRNFLIPQGYAVLATPSAKKAHSEIIKQRAHKADKMKEEAEALALKIKEVNLKVRARAGASKKIFGSVTTIAIAEALQAENISIDRKSLQIEGDTIKELGTYTAIANLHKEVAQSFQFEVIAE